jgi:hypothetical protein
MLKADSNAVPTAGQIANIMISLSEFAPPIWLKKQQLEFKRLACTKFMQSAPFCRPIWQAEPRFSLAPVQWGAQML